VNANPLENIYWYKNGIALSNQLNQYQHIQSQLIGTNYRIDKYDISNLNDFFKNLFTLSVLNAKKDDFGKYECCAMNAYGQVCSSMLVHEIKGEDDLTNTVKPIRVNVKTVSWPDSSMPISEDVKKQEILKSLETKEVIKAARMHTTHHSISSTEASSTLQVQTDLDLANSLDKRRHNLNKSKQFLLLESKANRVLRMGEHGVYVIFFMGCVLKWVFI
jgi:hypothetical protein